MLRALTNWLAGRRAPPDAPWQALQAWSGPRQIAFDRDPKGDGFGLTGRLGATAWRLEWGRPQRLYVRGRGELRLHADLRLAPELHLMILDQPLQRRLERAVLDQIAGAADGRVDPHMPAEMRWVVTFPRLDTQQAGWPDGLEAVASHPEWLMGWASGPLAQALGEPTVCDAGPWVLTIGGGRLELRAALDDPAIDRIEAWLGVFTCALREARRVQVELGETGDPTTLPSLWAVPREEPDTDGPGSERRD